MMTSLVGCRHADFNRSAIERQHQRRRACCALSGGDVQAAGGADVHGAAAVQGHVRGVVFRGHGCVGHQNGATVGDGEIARDRGVLHGYAADRLLRLRELRMNTANRKTNWRFIVIHSTSSESSE